MGVIRAAYATRIISVCLAKPHATIFGLSGGGTVPIVASTICHMSIATLDHVLLVMSSTIEFEPLENTHGA